MEISPQAWGCTCLYASPAALEFNLPTGVGMYRPHIMLLTSMVESPHRRGDVPLLVVLICFLLAISPQAWGCTVCRGSIPRGYPNLPTGVGMYRAPTAPGISPIKSPHRRGDVPFCNACLTAQTQISPQAWGCTVAICAPDHPKINLPTGVGMYRGLPCAGW